MGPQQMVPGMVPQQMVPGMMFPQQMVPGMFPQQFGGQFGGFMAPPVMAPPVMAPLSVKPLKVPDNSGSSSQTATDSPIASNIVPSQSQPRR